jgi:hypothetical protein
MTNSANPNALPLARRWLALTLAGRLAEPDNAKAEIGGSAGPGLKSKPVLDLGEFRPVRVGAGRLARKLNPFDCYKFLRVAGRPIAKTCGGPPHQASPQRAASSGALGWQ